MMLEDAWNPDSYLENPGSMLAAVDETNLIQARIFCFL